MNTYNLMYLIAKWYLIIAGINWLIAFLMIYLTLNKYIEKIGCSFENNIVKVLVALIVPVIYGLGWIFFVPKVLCTAFSKK